MALRDKMVYDKDHGWIWKNPTEAIRAANPEAYGTAPTPAPPPPGPVYAPPPAEGTPVGGSTAPAGAAPPAYVPDPTGTVSNDPLTDPNALDRFITPENTLINQRIGWDVRETDSAKIDKAFSQALAAARGGGANVGDSANLQYMFDQLRSDFEGGLNREDLIRRQFEGQQPFFDAQYEDMVKSQMERTAGMGRTGSGMYDREFADITERSRLQREGLLGQLTAQAAAQAIQDRLGLYGAGTGMAGVEANRDIAGAQISNQFRGQGLQALLGAAGLDLNRQGADIGIDMARRNALMGEREHEYRMSRDAMADQAMQMAYMNQGGNQNNPLNQINQTVGAEQRGAETYGTSAGQINTQLGDVAEGQAAQPTGDMVAEKFGTPVPRPYPNRPRLTRPGSTINTTPIPVGTTDYSDIRRGA